MTDLAAALGSALRAELAGARALRRRIHAAPLVSGEEAGTTDTVLAAMPAGAAVERVAATGALVRIGAPGPSVAVRAELDALPIVEETGVAWAATNGAMHACGHDVHLAALVALTRAVATVGPPAPLVALLQPREESYPSGARDVVAEGALARHAVTAVIGAHVQPVLEPGEVACTPGGVNAAADEFVITMHGEPGHAAYPHRNRDPVLAIAQCVVSLQQLVSRDSDPMVPTVLTVGAIHAGEAANATPATATARGVLRTLSEPARAGGHARLREIATAVAQLHRCAVDVEILEGEPVLENDPALSAATAVLLGVQGVRVAGDLRSCGADDFAYYAQRLPSLMLFVGTEGGAARQLHHPAFLPPDDTVDRVAEAMLAGYLAAAARIPVP